MSKGKLIVLEGLDGSGKATQAKLLAEHLEREGVPVRKITFPDYESQASALVRMYLAGEFGAKPEDVNAYAASSFFAVDRYASYKKDWGSFYQAGGVLTPRIGILPPMECISAPSCRRSSGRLFWIGCLITSSGCWGCLPRTACSTIWKSIRP